MEKENGQCYKHAKINIAGNLSWSTDIIILLLLHYCVILIRILSAMILLLYFASTGNVVQFLSE
jgi:hypothetical protein